MMPRTSSALRAIGATLASFLTATLLIAQETQGNKFFDVQISKDEIYSYTNLKFTGDYASFESAKGFLALGRTEAGVTVLIILGGGTVSVQAPAEVQEKFKTVFSSYPLSAAFKTVYMRLHPKEFEEAFAKQSMTKVGDEAAFNAAKQLFDDSFTRSYRAGSKALLPPYKTRVMEFDVTGTGLVCTEEGYWLTLRKYSPYGSVYPRDFVNPKQK